jgi:hypothetical protein
MQPPQQKPGESLEDYQRRVEEFKKTYEANLSGTTRPSLPAGANNPFYSVSAANGGRIGYQEGGMGNVITQATQEAFFGQPQMPMMANGGRIGYADGTSFQRKALEKKGYSDMMQNMTPKEISQLYDSVMGTFSRRFQAEGSMPMGEPRRNPAGIMELDYRNEGGFVPPIGIKERADDIPAMLSNNEFVFTADAVKNADPEGEQDPERGAREMYVLMKRLESGGRV